MTSHSLNKAKWQKGTRLHEKLTYVIYVFETITCEKTNMNCFWMHFFASLLHLLFPRNPRNVFIIEWWYNYSTSRFQFQGNRKVRRSLPSQKYLKLKLFRVERTRFERSENRVRITSIWNLRFLKILPKKYNAHLCYNK